MAGDYTTLLARLTDPSTNGWANILARGGTFTWEVWQPSDANGDSMSHGWGSNVLVEIQQWLLGVRPTGPGFETFEVTPPSSGLLTAKGSVPTPRGDVVVEWQRTRPDAPATSLDLIVPANASATVLLSGIDKSSVTEGGIPVGDAPGVTVTPSTASEPVLQVGSGTYSFSGAPTAS
jgi:alpha-L-rhamnosidase